MRSVGISSVVMTYIILCVLPVGAIPIPGEKITTIAIGNSVDSHAAIATGDSSIAGGDSGATKDSVSA